MSNYSTAQPSHSTRYSYDQCYFIGDQPADYSQFFPKTYMAILIINGLICLPTIVGNFAIILGICITPSLQTVSNVLLIGLASCDIGVGLLVPPLNIARIILKLHGSPFNNWCIVQVPYTFFGVMFCGVSFLTVAGFTIDKYLALHWHLRYATIVTTRRVFFILLSFWVIFGAMSTIQIWSMTMYRISVCIVVPIFLLGTSITYISIYRVLRRHNFQIQTQSKSTGHNDIGVASTALNMARYRKSVTSMFVVYCLFVLCYIPYICVQIITLYTTLIYKSDHHSNDFGEYMSLYVAVDVTETVVILNSFMNPLIYCWRMREIRQAAKRALLMIGMGTVIQPLASSRIETIPA